MERLQSTFIEKLRKDRNSDWHIRLGRVNFSFADELQDAVIDSYRKKGDFVPVVFTLEHEPVITCGKSTKSANLLLTEEEYKRRGIDVKRIDRGGDVTWHGPGQLVVYPIIDLRKSGLRIGEYVRILEEAMINTLKRFGVEGLRRAGMIGCWTHDGKIGAIGTSVKSGGITKHGLAFNVQPDMENFTLIVPCGIAKYPVTSMEKITGKRFDLSEVAEIIVDELAALLNINGVRDRKT